MLTKINEIQAKSVLTKSGLPGSDFVVNPYNGCQFACMYCYAAQIARWKHPGEEWGSFLDVKLNAPELLKAELEKLEKKFKSKNLAQYFFVGDRPIHGNGSQISTDEKMFGSIGRFRI